MHSFRSLFRLQLGNEYYSLLFYFILFFSDFLYVDNRLWFEIYGKK